MIIVYSISLHILNVFVNEYTIIVLNGKTIMSLRMVYRNYTPKQYVSSGKRLHHPFIHRKPGPPRTCSKTIVGPGEIPASVTHPCLFGAMFC